MADHYIEKPYKIFSWWIDKQYELNSKFMNLIVSYTILMSTNVSFGLRSKTNGEISLFF